ncbi:MAG: two-component system, NtrC family, nitrogen regulation sensor histidine kinase NtrY [Acidobacteriota bacterium]|nr:two-component system, NtrC family, nitrogen regulation sensor histidine kinase NtrY [Acidobacteriota bacterium]
MNFKVTVTMILALLAAAALVFFLFERELAGAWFTFGVHPDVTGLLERSLDDQKKLARGDPEHAPEYRRRFDATEAFLGRLRILELNRGEIVGRYEAVLLGLFAGILTLGSAVYALRERRQGARLSRLQGALAELAAGGVDVRVGEGRERRRDLIGRIAGMVEETSRVIARDRRRLASLENLSAWQEAARRQAHEMRTPLTAARLELSRLREVAGEAGEGETGRLAESAMAEIERLGRLTQAFTAFARLPEPALARRDLVPFLAEYVETFGAAWSNLALSFTPPERPVRPAIADFDPEMIRQVLVNLCDNSALALGGGSGRVTFSLGSAGEWTCLDVADDGPGVPAAIRPRLFEPYVTTRRVGEGMGLGLAISRKILLDHGGDLELAGLSAPRPGTGAVFRLLFPRIAGEEGG